MTGKKPNTVAAACIYIIAEKNGLKSVSLNEIANGLETTAATVRKLAKIIDEQLA